MQENPKLKIKIEGHVCCLPDNYTYYSLSENRARAVLDYLLDNGIDLSRMQYEGFGSSRKAVKPERTPEDQQKNRRVEIRILEK